MVILCLSSLCSNDMRHAKNHPYFPPTERLVEKATLPFVTAQLLSQCEVTNCTRHSSLDRLRINNEKDTGETGKICHN